MVLNPLLKKQIIYTMDKLPKFIIEGGNLILMKVVFHKEIATDYVKVKGGGMFKFNKSDNTFILSGESYDFGKAKIEDIRVCIQNKNVYSDKSLYRNISNFKFVYNDNGNIIEL